MIAAPSLPSPPSRETQRRFPFSDLGTGAPLLTISAVRSLLNRDEDAVLYLIEDGQLAFAFDLAMPGARRMELRVWRGALAAMNRSHLTPALSPSGEGGDLARVIADILPPLNAAVIRSATLAQRWVCSRTHVHELLDAELLTEVGAEARKATNSRNLTRASAGAFLRARRYGARG